MNTNKKIIVEVNKTKFEKANQQFKKQKKLIKRFHQKFNELSVKNHNLAIDNYRLNHTLREYEQQINVVHSENSHLLEDNLKKESFIGQLQYWKEERDAKIQKLEEEIAKLKKEKSELMDENTSYLKKIMQYQVKELNDVNTDGSLDNFIKEIKKIL